MSRATAPLLLESGDRLSRDEFHRRYCELPRVRAELIQGVVYVASPTRGRVHGLQHAAVASWIGVYASRHPDLLAMVDTTVFLEPETEVQPDAMLFREPAVLGGAHFRDDDYVEGAPQLVVEVAASSVSYDLHDKLRAYERAGTAEYIVWRVLDGALDWFRLQDGTYARVEPGADGLIESSTFPGLRLHVAKLLAGDMAGVLAALG